MLLELTQVLAALAAQPAPGEPPAEAPIVVTASRIAAGPVAGVTRVEAAEIERLQPASLLEALDDVAGVRAFSTGGVGRRQLPVDPRRRAQFHPGAGRRDQAQQPDQQPRRRVRFLRDRSAAGRANRGRARRRLRGARRRCLVGSGQHPAARADAGRDRAERPGERGQRGRCRPLRSASTMAGENGGLLVSAGWYDSGGLDLDSNLERRQALARIDQRIGGVEARALGLYAACRPFRLPRGQRRPAARRQPRSAKPATSTCAPARCRCAGRPAPSAPASLVAYSEQRDDSVTTPAIAPGRARRRARARRRHALLALRGDRRYRLRPAAR